MKTMMFMGLVLGAFVIASCASSGNPLVQPDIEGVFAYRVGQIEVFMLVEAERDGNTGILIGADQELLSRYIPTDGFKHTANAFLVKTNGQNILIDAGTGAGGIIVDKIKRLGVEPEQVNAVLITHLHGDHFGGLQRDGAAIFPNAKIYLAASELEFFTQTNVNQGAVAALAAYENNVVTFTPDEPGTSLTEIFTGIYPIAAFGHTPGHTLYLIQNQNDRLLIIGDLLHVALVQFAHPEISATFDVDPVEAAVIRRQILEYAAQNKIPLGGMHIVYPGIGTVETEGEGLKFTPVK
ncbi:MAG: MBL fold metallo-hydrolase [Treponema sp.]|jgi:glyoxylase-like metal-dependent hydrolase (beta-lactamase superfamily II)|nr:MBL fold metallo-hydrolase [Treponema sp.]